MTTTGTPLGAELSTIAIIITVAAAMVTGTHSAGKETEVRIEVTVNVEAHTTTRERQLSRSRGIRAPLAATPIHAVKATRALGGSVITTTAERREVTRQEGVPASAGEALTLVEAFTAAVAAVSAAVAAAHI